MEIFSRKKGGGRFTFMSRISWVPPWDKIRKSWSGWVHTMLVGNHVMFDRFWLCSFCTRNHHLAREILHFIFVISHRFCSFLTVDPLIFSFMSSLFMKVNPLKLQSAMIIVKDDKTKGGGYDDQYVLFFHEYAQWVQILNDWTKFQEWMVIP